jgi:hypothetical protein
MGSITLKNYEELATLIGSEAVKGNETHDPLDIGRRVIHIIEANGWLLIPEEEEAA